MGYRWYDDAADTLRDGSFQLSPSQIPDLSSTYARAPLTQAHALANATAYDNPTQRTAGALGNLYTGQAWNPIGSNPPKYVTAGAAPLPAITYGTNPPAAGDEFFANVQLGAAVLRGGGRFRIRNTAPTTINGNCIIGCWDGTTNHVAVHLIMTNYQYYASYVLNGSQVAVAPDVGAPPPGAHRRFPLVADSITEYQVDWLLDVANSRLYVWWPDGTVQSFTDPHFAQLSTVSTQAFCEGQMVATTDAVFEWTEFYSATDVTALPTR